MIYAFVRMIYDTMKNISKLLAVAMLLPLPALCTESRFATNNEGWIIIDHDSSANPLPSSGVNLSNTNPVAAAGSLIVEDIGNGWNWTVAPAKFHVDWSAFTGLEIDLTTDDSLTIHNLLLFISDGTNRATYVFPIINTPASSVLNLSAPLLQAQWQVTGNWTQLIANVNAFYVRIDLNNNVVSEVNLVDRVQLVDGTELPDRTFPVKFPTQTGRDYQVESSVDLDVWKNVGMPVQGDGSEVTIQVPLSDAPKRFFRARRLGAP